MTERVIRLEERTDQMGKQLERLQSTLDRMDQSLQSVSVNIAKLPDRSFLVTSLIAVLAIALAVAALTFQVADYAAGRAAAQGQSVGGGPSEKAPGRTVVPEIMSPTIENTSPKTTP